MNPALAMDGFGDLTTWITLAIAVAIFLRLRSVLGRRDGHRGRPPADQARARGRAGDAPAAPPDNVVDLGKRPASAAERESAATDATAAIDKMARAGSPLHARLREIAAADPTFNPEEFLSGAKMAYEMIVTAFADGDRKTLRNLLSREVLEGFSKAIADREARGEQVRASFVGIDQAKITAAEIVRGEAHVTARFVSQIVSATHDASGKLIEGDPDQVAEVTDLWTFARELKAKDPNWKLVATESEG